MRLPKARFSTEPVTENKDIINFLGLNRLPKTNKGELKQAKNLYTKYPGCLYPRPPRNVIKTLANGKALFACNNGKMCWVDGTSFVYDGVTKGTVTASEKSIVDFYGVVLIFPDKKYYNYNTGTFGNIGSGSPSDGEAPTGNQCPNMDRVCIFNNRVWGIKNKTVYASKFGDPFVWSKFSVPSMEDDSVYFKISDERGNLTSIIPLENHILFNTASSTHELYGTRPSNFLPQLVTNSKGCIDGRSLVEIDGVIYMLASDGVYSYSGSTPRTISLQLDEKYVSGVAGTDGRRYYISLYNGDEYNLYVYDTLLGIWLREDDLNVIDFTANNGVLYALADNKIYKFNDGNENVEWEAETDEFTEEYMGKKITSKIKVEAELEHGSMLQIYLRTDDSSYSLVDTFDYSHGKRMYKSYMIPQRAFYFQFKFVGVGNATVLSLTREIIYGSDM